MEVLHWIITIASLGVYSQADDQLHSTDTSRRTSGKILVGSREPYSILGSGSALNDITAL